VGFVQTLGSAVKGSSSLTTALTLTANTTVGNRVIVSSSVVASATAQTLTVTDSKGNTWTQHAIDNALAAFTTAQFSSVLTTALVSGDTITVTQSGTATANGFIQALEFSGATTPITSSTGRSGSNVATVTGISVTQAAGSFFIGILHTGNGGTPASTGSLTAPWNARETGQTGSTSLHWYAVWDQTQAAGATVGFAPTLSSSASYGGMLTGFTTSSANVAGGTLTLSGAAPASGTAPAAGSVSLTGSTNAPTGTPGTSGGLMTLSGASSAGTASVIHHWVGAPTSGGFRVRARTSGATSCRLAVSTSPAMTAPTYFGPQTPSGGYVDFTATGLAAGHPVLLPADRQPRRRGAARVRREGEDAARAGTASFKFAFGGCTNGYNANREAVDDIRSWGADFFLHLGDFHYKSLTSTDPTVHRQGWEDQIRFAPGLLELTRDVPWWYCRSDHEAGPDNGDSNNAYTAASSPATSSSCPTARSATRARHRRGCTSRGSSGGCGSS
jgi:hypothetical protein